MLSFAPMKKELLFTKQALKFLDGLPADVRANSPPTSPSSNGTGGWKCPPGGS